MISFVPTISHGPNAEAAPTLDAVVFGGAVVNVGTNTTVTSGSLNNVINWKDYSVAGGEKISYDAGTKTNNYLNIVTGNNTSQIYGTIEGGNNVYIVNPHGVIFGKGASVDVGNLYVSTQDASTLNTAAFENSGTSPIDTTAAGLADVVNMGNIKATTVEVTGKNIRFLSNADVTAKGSNVVLNTASDGYAHIGYGYKADGTVAGEPNASEYYTVNGSTATKADNYYKLVSSVTELQAINSDLTGNYMLANDIDVNNAAFAPIGGNGLADFTGKIDGNFFEVQQLKISGVDHAGLFGKISGASIYNLGVTNSTINGNTGAPGNPSATGYAARSTGGLAGSASANALLKNVYSEGNTISGQAAITGGIVGFTTNATIDTAYNTSTLGSSGGGIVGYGGNHTLIKDTYNDGVADAGIVRSINPATAVTVRNAYTTSKAAALTRATTFNAISNAYVVNTSNGTMTTVGTTTAPTTTGNQGVQGASYAGFNISNDGLTNTTWRIYEGRTTPLLTAFMKGAASATYNYGYFDDKTGHAATSNAVSNNGKDITGLVYNGDYVKITDAAVGNQGNVGDKSNVIYSSGSNSTVDTDLINDYVNTGSQDFDKTNGIRNAGTKAILWSSQRGYNLTGVNVTINKREVKLDGGALNVSRMYNGKKDVKDAFVRALKSGSVTTSGVVADDVANNTVSLNTSSFTANMADKHVGTNKNVTFGGTITFSGEDAGNYTFDNSSISNITGKVTITKAPLYLIINKKTADAKIYDGTDTVIDAAMKQTGGTPNIKLNKSITDGISDGTLMIDDNGTVDTVDINAGNDPTYVLDSDRTKAAIHVGSHKLKYTGVELNSAYTDSQNYELFYTPAGSSKTKVENSTVYLDGNITRRLITRDGFGVYKKADNSVTDATKIYDGTNEYTLDTSAYYLSAGIGASVANSGIVSRDQGHITFALAGGKGTFQNASGNAAKNVAEAEKVAYNVTAASDNPGEYLLSDYMFGDSYNPVAPNTNVNLESAGGLKVTGAGKITPKTLTAAVANGNITKTYDAMAEVTDGNRNLLIGDNIVTISGLVSGDSITNTSTGTYASKNVDANNDGGTTSDTQTVTYTASFTTANAAEADNYTFATPAGTTTVIKNKTLTGSGTITPRSLTVNFSPVSKTYDGTVANNTISVTGIDDGLNKAVLTADGITTASLSTSGITSAYGDGNNDASFIANANAGSRSVKYTGLSNTFGSNYSVANTHYGTGTINRRRIDPTGFQVRRSDGTVADATKVYDGTSDFTLSAGASLVTPQAAVGTDTGIVSKDYGKVTFRLKDNAKGTFTKDAAGNNATSHVSEAKYVAYDIVAQTSDATNNPLTNYEFGTLTYKRNLETVNNANPAHATAAGVITPANVTVTTNNISKTYDGLIDHTDGSRNAVTGNTVVTINGLLTDTFDGTSPTNTSSAEYADKNVSYDGGGNVTTKTVKYKAQLTGKYADDYQIVDSSGIVISSLSGSGDNKTLTTSEINVANAGKITPRTLTLTMGDVSKTYDGTAANNYYDGVSPHPAIAPTTVLNDGTSSKAVISGDNVTVAGLIGGWQTAKNAGDATSRYGRVNGVTFTTDSNASNGNKHDVEYTGWKKAFENAFGTTAAGNYTLADSTYGKGTISRAAIDPNGFKVVDAHGHAANATKVYDGTSTYNVPTGWSLSSNVSGIISNDSSKIKFSLASGGAYFTDAGDNATAKVAEAKKVKYAVNASTYNAADAYLLKNYTVNGQNLESGDINVSGAGTITRRDLVLSLVNNSGIDKVYDSTNEVVDSNGRKWETLVDNDVAGNVQYNGTDKLVSSDGTSFTIVANYADKNVAYNGSNVADKNITYTITLNGDATNYKLNGTELTNTDNSVTLSATGKITPKDLSGSLAAVSKIYDGTTNVDSSKVAFAAGGVYTGDAVSLGTHNESYQSANVNGDGTTATINGAVQKNWVNYSNLTLSGTDAGNYRIDSTANGLGTITPYKLQASDFNHTFAPNVDKIYNGTTEADKTKLTSLNFNKGFANDGFTHTVTAANFAGANSNNAATQNVTYNVTLTADANTDAANYDFSGLEANRTLSLTTTGKITARDVYVTVLGTPSKVYDGTTAVKGSDGNTLSPAQLVTFSTGTSADITGLLGNDGTVNATTAVYDDKNAGTGKTVTYTLKLTGGDTSNYNITSGTGCAAVATDGSGVKTTAGSGNITPLTVMMSFGDVQKDYDTTAVNRNVNVNFGSAKAILNADGATESALNSSAAITSYYGSGTTDSTFVKNPEVVSDAGGAVIHNGKDVQYNGIQNAMQTLLGSNAGNYTFDDTAYGKGTINKRTISSGDISYAFAAGGANKIYDGTTDVKYNESAAVSDVKNYITGATITINGNPINILGDIVVNTANYDNKNVNGGASQNVTYDLSYTGGNLNIIGNLRPTSAGTIQRRALNLGLVQNTGIDKVYDGNKTVLNANADDTKRWLSLTDDDAKGNVQYIGTNKLVGDGTSFDIKAEYSNKNVAKSGGVINDKNITYKINLNGDATNYTINGVSAENGATITGATGKITPRELTLNFDYVTKIYDGETTNTEPRVILSIDDGSSGTIIGGDGITAGAFNLTNINSDFGVRANDGTFTPDANVAYIDNDKTKGYADKDVRYTNLAGSLNNDNYIVKDTGYGKGKIVRGTLSLSDFTMVFNKAVREYDGTNTIGEHTWKNDKNKLFDAYVNVDTGAINYSKINLPSGTSRALKASDVETISGVYTGGKNANEGVNNPVDYTIKFNTANYDLAGGWDGYYRSAAVNNYGEGEITRRDLSTKLPTYIFKEYDGVKDFTQADDVFATALANANIMTVVAGDEGKVQFEVKGKFDSKNASLATKEPAEAIAKAIKDDPTLSPTGGRNVSYELTLTGSDAATLANYKVSNTTITKNNGGDIYKRTLILTPDKVSKSYDTTAVNKELNANSLLSDGTVGNAVITADGITVAKLKAAWEASAVSGSSYGDNSMGVFAIANPANAKNGYDVRYQGLQAALAAATDNNGVSAGTNYRIDDTAYGTGDIKRANVTLNDFDIVFKNAQKEYDNTTAAKYNGSSATDKLWNYIDKTNSKVTLGGVQYALPTTDVVVMSGTYTNGVNASTANNPVSYRLDLNSDNYNFTDGSGGIYTGQGSGTITARRLVADIVDLNPTKFYDTTNKIVGADGTTELKGNNLVTIRHYGDNEQGLINADGTQNDTTAVYKSKRPSDTDDDAGDKNVIYTLALAGGTPSNYVFVDASTGTEISMLTGEGTIKRREVMVTAKPVEVAINDGLPTHYTGGYVVPSGYETEFEMGLTGHKVVFHAPNARLRPGKYAIEGYNNRYSPTSAERFYVGKNFVLVQAPANSTALTVGNYYPTSDYGDIMSQNRMIPNEYVYENTSKDMTGSFGRDSTRMFAYLPDSEGGLAYAVKGSLAAKLRAGERVIVPVGYNLPTENEDEKKVLFSLAYERRPGAAIEYEGAEERYSDDEEYDITYTAV